MAQFLLVTTLLTIAGIIATGVAGFLASPGPAFDLVLDLFAGADEEEHGHRLRKETDHDGAQGEHDVLRYMARCSGRLRRR